MITIQDNDNPTKADNFIIQNFKSFLERKKEQSSFFNENVEIIPTDNIWLTKAIETSAANDKESADANNVIPILVNLTFIKKFYLLVHRVYAFYLNNLQKEHVVDFYDDAGQKIIHNELEEIKKILSSEDFDRKIEARIGYEHANEVNNIFNYCFLFAIFHEIAHKDHPQISTLKDEIECDEAAQHEINNIIRNTFNPDEKRNAESGAALAVVIICLLSLDFNSKLDTAIQEEDGIHPRTTKRVKNFINKNDKDGYIIREGVFVLPWFCIVFLFNVDIKKVVKVQKNYDSCITEILDTLDFNQLKMIFKH
jgi:hypothetical protein